MYQQVHGEREREKFSVRVGGALKLEEAIEEDFGGYKMQYM